MGFLEIFQLHAPLKHKAKEVKTSNGSNVQAELDRLERLHAFTNGTDSVAQIFSLGEYEKVIDTELSVYSVLSGLICKWYLNLECIDDQEVEAVLFFDGVRVPSSACNITANAGQKVYLSGMFEHFGPEETYHTLEIMVKTEIDKAVKTIGLNRGISCEEKNIAILDSKLRKFGWRV